MTSGPYNGREDLEVNLPASPREEARHGLGQQLVRHHGLEVGERGQEWRPHPIHKHQVTSLAPCSRGREVPDIIRMVSMPPHFSSAISATAKHGNSAKHSNKIKYALLYKYSILFRFSCLRTPRMTPVLCPAPLAVPRATQESHQAQTKACN